MTPRPPDTHSASACLYFGKVMHARLKPMGHRFSYRTLNLLIDLDRLGEADRETTLFAVNRRGLYSFHESDHGLRDGTPLRDFVQNLASERGVDLAGGRVQLLCSPRQFGYVFNPLSVYFCYHADGHVLLLIYEVRNTFGEIHHYALPVDHGQSAAPVIRQQQSKEFYVSPFIASAATYHFRVSPPSDSVKIRILETDEQGPLLAATLHGTSTPLTATALLRASALLPFATFKTVAAIHWQALRLWLKGAKIVPRSGEAGAGQESSRPGLKAVPH